MPKWQARGLNAELELQTAEILRLRRKPLTWLTFEKGRRRIARLQRKSAPFRARADRSIGSAAGAFSCLEPIPSVGLFYLAHRFASAEGRHEHHHTSNHHRRAACAGRRLLRPGTLVLG
jgi:hypothetical protein